MAVIDIRNFRKSFGNKVVHQGVSFTVEKGECMGLIGGSGTGKSVILRSLIGLEKPDSGQVFIDGVDVTTHSEKMWLPLRKRIAYVFQGGALFDSLTVFENLAYPLKEHTQFTSTEIADRVHGLLEQFGLRGNENVYPSSLSGGLQKRVGLARAIIMNPDVILYDEPTAGLDPYNSKKILEMILNLKKTGVTSILVTHDMPIALAACERLAMLMDGTIKAIGKPDELEKEQGSLISKFILGEMR